MRYDDYDDYVCERVDHCYECRIYGGDYHFDENGKLVSFCADCIWNRNDPDD